MSDMAGIAGNAVSVYQQALTTVSNNIANVSTEGYSRQDVKLNALPVTLVGNIFLGSGVQVERVQRQYNEFVERNLRNTVSDLAAQEPMVNYTNRVVDIMGGQSMGLSSALDQFFLAGRALSGDASSTVMRGAFLREAEGITERFSQLSAQLDLVDVETLQSLESAVGQINGFAADLALVNKQLTKQKSESAQPADLLDQRDLLLKKLSQFARVNTQFTPNGTVKVSLGSTINLDVLVDGNFGHEIEAISDPKAPDKVALVLDPYGNSRSLSGITSGSLAGLISFREEVMGSTRTALNGLAQTFAKEINAVHQEGIDGYGNVGKELFSFDPAKLNAAAGLRVAFDDPMRISSAAQFRVVDGANNPSGTSASIAYLDSSGKTMASPSGPTDITKALANGAYSSSPLIISPTVSVPIASIASVANGMSDVEIYLDSNQPGQQLAVITRDGRQLIGASMAEAYALRGQLMTTSNGFAAGASYSDAYLNGARQSVALSGVATGQVSFSGRAIDRSASGDLPAATATKIVDDFQRLKGASYATAVSAFEAYASSATINVAAGLTAGSTYTFNVSGTARTAGQISFVATGTAATDATALANAINALTAGTTPGTATAASGAITFSAGTLGLTVAGVRTAAQVTAGVSLATAALLADNATAMTSARSSITSNSVSAIAAVASSATINVAAGLTAGSTYTFNVSGTAKTAGQISFVATGTAATDATALASAINALTAGSTSGTATAASGAITLSAGTVGLTVAGVRTAEQMTASVSLATAALLPDNVTAMTSARSLITSATINVAAGLTALSTYTFDVSGTAKTAGQISFVATGTAATDATALASAINALTAGSTSGTATATAFGAITLSAGSTLGLTVAGVRTAAQVAASVSLATAALRADNATAMTSASNIITATSGVVGSVATGGLGSAATGGVNPWTVLAGVTDIQIDPNDNTKLILVTNQTAPARSALPASSSGGISFAEGLTLKYKDMNVFYGAQATVKLQPLYNDKDQIVGNKVFAAKLDGGRVPLSTTAIPAGRLVLNGAPLDGIDVTNTGPDAVWYLADALNRQTAQTGVTALASNTILINQDQIKYSLPLYINGERVETGGVTNLDGIAASINNTFRQTGTDADGNTYSWQDVEATVTTDKQLQIKSQYGADLLIAASTSGSSAFVNALGISSGTYRGQISLTQPSAHIAIIEPDKINYTKPLFINGVSITNSSSTASTVLNPDGTYGLTTGCTSALQLAQLINETTYAHGISSHVSTSGQLILSNQAGYEDTDLWVSATWDNESSDANALGILNPRSVVDGLTVVGPIKASLNQTTNLSPIQLGFGPNGSPADLTALGFRTGAFISGAAKDDLLVFATGAGLARVTASYAGKPVDAKQTLRAQTLQVVFKPDTNPKDPSTTLSYTITSTDPANGRSTVVAKRYFDDKTLNPGIVFQGLQLSFTAPPGAGDVFDLDGNKDGIGNNDNMLALVALEKASLVGNKTLANAYIDHVNNMGNVAIAAQISQTALTVVHDQAVSTRDDLAGVSLDKEAVDLIRYQQAYQAAAKALQTAISLFDSILQVR